MNQMSQERIGTILFGLVGVLITGGCPSRDADKAVPPPGELVRSAKQRVTSPDVADADLREVVGGNSDFGFDLYQQVRGEKGNVFYSPYSISIALAMTFAGARNETEEQMADTLRFTLAQDRLHPAFNALDLSFAGLGRNGAGGDDDKEPFRLEIVNWIWGQVGFSFLPTFLDVLAENYGAGISLLDFLNAPEESRLAINDWVSGQTEDRIQDLIPKGVISQATRLVLTNAIYFKAAWAQPFDKAKTRDGSFTLLDDTRVTVPMMHQVASFGYATGDGYQAIELAYEGDELSMVIILPDADRFEEFEGTLDAGLVETIAQELNLRQIELTMPRFTFKWQLSLVDVLSAMGMPIAFGPGLADFSGMTGDRSLFIRDVIHQAFVAVDEAGTEAAAATAVILDEVSAPLADLVVAIYRPFVFLIRAAETGSILFVGRVLDPSR